MFWTGVFLGPCSSNPLREPRNLRGIFAGCELFPCSCTAFWSLLGEILSSPKIFRCFTIEVSGITRSQGSDHHRHYCCLLFPKSFYFDFQVLVFSDFFHIRYVMSQMFVCLNFKVPQNFDFFILQQFLDIVFNHFSDAGKYGISCTDSNVALQLLYYDALYNLFVQFYCMN